MSMQLTKRYLKDSKKFGVIVDPRNGVKSKKLNVLLKIDFSKKNL